MGSRKILLPVGFSKLAGGILKNHYPKGLRWM
ncbi:MAG TPA: hypothetical protein DEQ64_00685 [Lachnoclostridium sp.]|nr:hypothetical protein [Lachnoclostridium sp.]